MDIIKDPDAKGMLPVALDSSVTKLDFWGYNDQEVTILNEAADGSEVVIDTLEIVAQNFAKVTFAIKKFVTKVRNLIIRNCVVNDWGNVTPDNLIVITYSNVQIPTVPSSTTLVAKVEEDPDDVAIRTELSGMCITPGSGEAVYGMNAQASLDRMLEIFPHMKEISPVVCGFVTSTDLGKAKVLPGVESRTGAPWQSGAFDRTNAHLITQNGGSVNFGGTPPDADLLSYLDYAKSKGLKIMLTPMLMVDTPEKPWRGDLQSSVADTIKWFVNEYKPWLLGYARLVQGKVDSFLIGSELKKISQTDDGSHTFPIIDLLIGLAQEVKAILGKDVAVSYGADWSEYHHNDHAYRPMDKLWADPSIDFVGISAYFPITFMHTTRITLSDLIREWRSGVAFDYWTDSEGVRHAMPSEWGFKAVEEWLSTIHYFDPAKTQPTLWKPNMKPMKFTEFGCASINKATNAPNVFGKSDGKLNGVIPYSTEKPDNRIQKLYLRSTIEAWRGSDKVVGMLCWSYDARGESWYMNPYWADRGVHPYSHSLEGKIRTL